MPHAERTVTIGRPVDEVLRKVMSSMVTKTMQAEVAAIDTVKSLLES